MMLFTSRGLASLAAVSAGLLTVALPVTADARPAAAKKPTLVKVVGTDAKVTLSKQTVKAGKVKFKVTDKGKLSHTFRIAGKTTKAIAPGKSATLTVKLKKGAHTYRWTTRGHAAMKGALTVT